MSDSTASSQPVTSKAAPLTASERKALLQAALDARALAYCPYSNFRVGAALLLKDGRIIKGGNIENAAYTVGICAERAALSTAQTSCFPPSSTTTHTTSPLQGSIRALAVSSDLPSSPCSPCGACRQVVREFCELDTPIYMVWKEWSAEGEDGDADGRGGDGKVKGRIVRTLEELLPLSFGPEELARPR